MSVIDLEQITREADAASWREVYGVDRHWFSRRCDERMQETAFAGQIARRIIEHCILEINALTVLAPDAQIVKDKASARLRTLSAEIARQPLFPVMR